MHIFFLNSLSWDIAFLGIRLMRRHQHRHYIDINIDHDHDNDHDKKQSKRFETIETLLSLLTNENILKILSEPSIMCYVYLTAGVLTWSPVTLFKLVRLEL